MSSRSTSSRKNTSTDFFGNMFGSSGSSTNYMETVSDAMTSQLKASMTMTQLGMIANNPMLGLMTGKSMGDVMQASMAHQMFTGGNPSANGMMTFNPFEMLGMGQKQNNSASTEMVRAAPQNTEISKVLEEFKSSNKQNADAINRLVDISNNTTANINQINEVLKAFSSKHQEHEKNLVVARNEILDGFHKSTAELYTKLDSKIDKSMLTVAQQFDEKFKNYESRLDQLGQQQTTIIDDAGVDYKAELAAKDILIRRLQNAIEQNNMNNPASSQIKDVDSPAKSYITDPKEIKRISAETIKALDNSPHNKQSIPIVVDESPAPKKSSSSKK
jgi:hypothetical protein